MGDRRIGTVMKFAGEPPATRWQAFASQERKQGFRTMREAIAWLETVDRNDRQDAGERPANAASLT
jgi:hypothetical protein